MQRAPSQIESIQWHQASCVANYRCGGSIGMVNRVDTQPLAPISRFTRARKPALGHQRMWDVSSGLLLALSERESLFSPLSRKRERARVTVSSVTSSLGSCNPPAQTSTVNLRGRHHTLIPSPTPACGRRGLCSVFRPVGERANAGRTAKTVRQSRKLNLLRNYSTFHLTKSLGFL